MASRNSGRRGSPGEGGRAAWERTRSAVVHWVSDSAWPNTRAVVEATFRSFRRDRATLASAALAFYALLSLGPLVMIVTELASLVLGKEAARDALVSQLSVALGESSAQAVDRLARAIQSGDGAGAGVLGAIVSVYAATRVFASLHGALNQVFNVHLLPSRGLSARARTIALRRVRSALIVVALGVLLLVSVVVTTAIEAVAAYLPDVLRRPGVWRFAGLAVSFVLATGAFAILYRTIPDARIAWAFIWPGALLAGALFALGKLALGFYVGTYGAPSVDATAAALIVVLLWANYSSHVFFFGAELTEACAAHFGEGVEPEEHAERIEV